jgi:signal transduction histidine kinase
MFEPFYTRSRNCDKINSGTGLGLYIKKSLERLDLGFSISLEYNGQSEPHFS